MSARTSCQLLLLLLLSLCCGATEPPASSARGVEPLPEPAQSALSADSARSVGLFVGVRAFPEDSEIAEVPYAADDAVDLAYQLALPEDPRRRLLQPRKVHLALSGQPQKAESRSRLRKLLAAGARVSGASRAEIERWLAAKAEGGAALVWVSFATHGRSQGQDEYLLIADSRLDDLASTALPTQQLLAQVARRPAALRMVVLDACRELSSRSAFELRVDATSSGPLAIVQARVGGPLFDDAEGEQGVFTGALLNGLDCRAPTDERGRLTVASLAAHVNRRVTAWMRDRLGETIDEMKGIETHLGGTAGEQALLTCHQCERADQPDHFSIQGERLEVFATDGRLLWTHTTSGRISQAEIADLDGDGSQEVVVGVSTDGRQTGWALVFDCKGDEVWSVNTSAPSPYGSPAGTSGQLTLVRLTTADFFGTGRRQVATLSHDAQGWLACRLALYDFDGKPLGSYWHPGHLWHLKAAAETPGGKSFLVVAGNNNDLGAGLPGPEYVDGVLLFDPANIRGHAPPYHPTIERGTQLWYGAILPKAINVGAIDITDRDHDGKNEIALRMNLGHFLYLDFDGCPVSAGRGDAAREDPEASELRYRLVEGGGERCRGLR